MSRNGPLDGRFVVPVRTELQLSGWEGPEGVRLRVFRHTLDRFHPSGPRTPLFANPKPWTKQADCLDDWKAFDETRNVGHEVAEAMCSGCPVIGECLADAMAEEGAQAPVFRAGIRGGLLPVDRFALAVGDRECAEGHPFKKFGGVKPSGDAYCRECNRIGDKRRADTPGFARHQRIECPNCGGSILKRHKKRHMKTAICLEFVQ